MFSSTVLPVFLVLAVFALPNTFANPIAIKNQASIKIINVDHESKLKDLSLGAGLVPFPLTKSSLQRGSLISYTLGKLNSSYQIVAQGSDSQSWGSSQDVQLNLEYPVSGVGALLSYIQIDVLQDSNQGEAYVTSGGIGERQVTIIVLAYNTKSFSFAYNFYGSP